MTPIISWSGAMATASGVGDKNLKPSAYSSSLVSGPNRADSRNHGCAGGGFHEVVGKARARTPLDILHFYFVTGTVAPGAGATVGTGVVDVVAGGGNGASLSSPMLSIKTFTPESPRKPRLGLSVFS